MLKWPPLALAILIAVASLRHHVVARINDPAYLPALADDGRVHHQAEAVDCARSVAALLQDRMASVAAQQGRPFARDPIIGVYASFEDYARANGLGDAGVAAVSLGGRIVLSPTLCGEERDRLPRVLTHELSHSHLFGWRGSRGGRPPSWFLEGLAVMVSNGGAAEGVADQDALRALREGVAIVVTEDEVWGGFADIRFEREPSPEGSAEEAWTYRQRLAFKQAGLFVARLRDRDPKAFAGLLDRLMEGERFSAAFAASYPEGVARAWRRFVSG